MIIDVSTQLSEAIDNAIDNKIELLPKSFPCRIVSIKDDGVFVEVETLLKKGENDTTLEIPVMQSSYLKIPYNVGDIGLALNCSFLFDVILDDRDIEINLEALKNNALFFVPLVSKQNQKEDIKNLVLLNQNKDIKMEFKEDSLEANLKNKNIIRATEDEISVDIGGNETYIDKEKIFTYLTLQQGGLIDIVGRGGNLYKALDILIQLMDLLASGMNGSATTSGPYQGMRETLISSLKAIIKE